ncbi:MAG: hypothetical protein IJN71_02850 [Oscillospiraceae bacterium]|nr:hypothetical protein [Oscillospiraceae bacterium]
MKKYEAPKLDLIRLGTDIITTSAVPGLGVEDNADGTGTGNATGNGGHYFG